MSANIRGGQGRSAREVVEAWKCFAWCVGILLVGWAISVAGFVWAVARR